MSIFSTSLVYNRNQTRKMSFSSLFDSLYSSSTSSAFSAEPTENKTTILDANTYNGRVDIIQPPSAEVQFQLYEKNAIKNKATEYRDALAGTWESNVLAQVFFSKENVQILQNGIRAGVYKMSNDKYVIPPQNVDTLKIIMRSIYMQYAEHYPNNITEQVERLNHLVLDYAVPTVYNEAVGYLNYCKDQSTLVVPLELPRHHDRTYKQLELKKWV
jgi:hypothetical protein